MPWQLTDEVSPDARPTDVPAVPGTGSFALTDEIHPDAAAAEPASPAWYEHLLAGLRHRGGAIERQGAHAAEHPLESLMSLSPPVAMFNKTREALFPAQRNLSDLITGNAPGMGPAETKAAAALKAQDASDTSGGLGEGVMGSLLYGVGETPEAMLLPAAKLTTPLRSALASGAMQGGYSALVNDRDPLSAELAGLVGGGLGRGASKLGNKTLNALLGRWGNTEAQATDAAAKKMGVNLSAGDLDPGSIMSWFENKARWLPFTGVSEARRGQAQGIANTAQGIEDDLRAPIAGKLDSGITPEQMVAGSARAREKEARDRVRNLFAQVPGDVQVETPNFVDAIKALHAEYPDALTAGNNVAPQSVRKLVDGIVNPKKMELTPDDEALIEALGGRERLSARNWQQLQQHSPGIMGRAGGAELPPEPMSAMDAHWLQSTLGDVARAQEAQGANQHMTGLVHRARSALLEDLDNVDDQTVPEAFRTARAAFKREVAPFQNNPILRKLTSSPDAVDETLFSKLGPDRVDTARALMENLTPEGIAALRHGAASRAIEKGVNDKWQSGLSVPSLLRNLDLGGEMGNQRALTEILPPEIQSRVTGLGDVVRSARNAGTWSHEPPTGVQNVGLGIMSGLGAMLGAGGEPGHGMAMLAAAMAPSAVGRAVTGAGRTELGKRVYMAEGSGKLDPYIEALLAQAMAGHAQPASLFDQLGQ